MKRIPKKALQRPLQGNAYAVGYGNRMLYGPRQTLAQSYQSALDRANQANEQRYQQILAGYDQLGGRVMSDLRNVGQQERADINRNYQGMKSDVYNSLVNRGFGNGSLGATMRYGVERERAAAQGRLNDRMLQQRAGFDTNITQGRLGVMERRTDLGPDMNQLIALSQGYGRGGGNNLGSGYVLPPTINQDGYLNAYQNALMKHIGNMGPSGPYPVRPIQANVRAQETRRKRVAFKRLMAGAANPYMVKRYQGMV